MRKLLALTKILIELLEGSQSLSQDCTKQSSQKMIKHRRRPQNQQGTILLRQKKRENLINYIFKELDSCLETYEDSRLDVINLRNVYKLV